MTTANDSTLARAQNLEKEALFWRYDTHNKQEKGNQGKRWLFKSGEGFLCNEI